MEHYSKCMEGKGLELFKKWGTVGEPWRGVISL